MQDVRSCYEKEADAALKDDFMVILNSEDPANVIQGRGVIPRSP